MKYLYSCDIKNLVVRSLSKEHSLGKMLSVRFDDKGKLVLDDSIERHRFFKDKFDKMIGLNENTIPNLKLLRKYPARQRQEKTLSGMMNSILDEETGYENAKYLEINVRERAGEIDDA